MAAGESLLWCRDPFECFESLDELFDDDELLRLDDDLLLLLPLELLLWLSFVLVLLLWVCTPSIPDAFNVSELRLLDEVLVFIFDADCFDEAGVVNCVVDKDLAALFADFRWLFCDPFCDDLESVASADNDDDDDGDGENVGGSWLKARERRTNQPFVDNGKG